MSGVTVVDAESFRSTCHRCDAYIHDHARYSHNYAQFYQLLNSNLFTHRRISMLLREATSETYGTLVYSLSYKFPIYFYLHLYFLHLYFKIPKIFYLSDLTLVSDREGLDNP